MPPKRRASDLHPETASEAEMRVSLEQAIAEIASIKEEMKDVEKRLAYYDKMALKAGFFSMGFLCFGAMLSMGVDKIKDKIFSLMLP